VRGEWTTYDPPRAASVLSEGVSGRQTKGRDGTCPLPPSRQRHLLFPVYPSQALVKLCQSHLRPPQTSPVLLPPLLNSPSPLLPLNLPTHPSSWTSPTASRSVCTTVWDLWSSTVTGCVLSPSSPHPSFNFGGSDLCSFSFVADAISYLELGRHDGRRAGEDLAGAGEAEPDSVGGKEGGIGVVVRLSGSPERRPRRSRLGALPLAFTVSFNERY
jgi:hypothetical protein